MQASAKFKEQSFGNIVAAFFAGIGIHCIFLALNATILAFPCFKLPLREYRAVMIMASQKTLPVAVTVIGFLPESAGEQGLMVIPCIISHMSQIFMDAAIVSKWADDTEKAEAAGQQQEDTELSPKGGSSGLEMNIADLEAGSSGEAAAAKGVLTTSLNRAEPGKLKNRKKSVKFAETGQAPGDSTEGSVDGEGDHAEKEALVASSTQSPPPALAPLSPDVDSERPAAATVADSRPSAAPTV